MKDFFFCKFNFLDSNFCDFFFSYLRGYFIIVLFNAVNLIKVSFKKMLSKKNKSKNHSKTKGKNKKENKCENKKVMKQKEKLN